MFFRGLIAFILTLIIGMVLTALIAPLIMSTKALNKSSGSAGIFWFIIAIIVGVFWAKKGKAK